MVWSLPDSAWLLTPALQGYTVFSIPVGVVYRPNEAKVRNLKTKDYLGKARLVAASDRANAFTGFAGAEIRNAAKLEIKDDRPADNISFAATNLVKPNLQSRRQQSEPPNSRNVFPPTPPPDSDKGPTPGMSRGASVRNGPKPMPARLNIEKARPNERFERESPQERAARPQRSASSAAAAAPSRAFSQREPPRRRQSAVEEEDAYPDEVYDMYQGSGNGSSRTSRGQGQQRRAPPPQQQRYIEEEDEGGSDYDDGSFDEGDFEIVSNNRRGNSISSGSRTTSRKPEIRKIRVKVHAGDVRYIMIGAAIEFPDLVDKIRDKFGIRRRFKIKVKDDDAPDGEMITMGDQDDLDMVIMTAKQQARKQRLEAGKMEVSYPGVMFPCCCPPMNHRSDILIARSGFRKYRLRCPQRAVIVRNTAQPPYEIMTSYLSHLHQRLFFFLVYMLVPGRAVSYRAKIALLFTEVIMHLRSPVFKKFEDI